MLKLIYSTENSLSTSCINKKFCSDVAEISKDYLTAKIPVYSIGYSKYDYIV